MRHKLCYIIVAILTSALTAPALSVEKAYADFSQTNVISDSVYLDKFTMNEQAINDFLASKGSWLANYHIPEYMNVPYPVGKGALEYVSVRQVNPSSGEAFYGKTAAKLIYDKSQQFGINPRVILATLQKESSSVTRSTPSSDITAAWPMFYGFHDGMRNCFNSGASCESAASVYRQQAIDFGGIGKQFAYSQYFFWLNYNRYLNTFADPISISGQTIVCQTVGTRVLYRFTPSISGQQSFYNHFNSWWGPPNQGGSSGVNDTTNATVRTYESSLRLAGTKRSDHSVFYGGQSIGSGTSWQVTVSLPIGSTNYTFQYRDGSNNVVGEKIITVIRHEISDINSDGKIDVLDLSLFSESYGQDEQTADPMSDLNGDGKVNILDLSIFAEKYR